MLSSKRVWTPATFSVLSRDPPHRLTRGVWNSARLRRRVEICMWVHTDLPRNLPSNLPRDVPRNLPRN